MELADTLTIPRSKEMHQQSLDLRKGPAKGGMQQTQRGVMNLMAYKKEALVNRIKTKEDGINKLVTRGEVT